jgi:predicted amidohydrolase YtcJ
VKRTAVATAFLAVAVVLIASIRVDATRAKRVESTALAANLSSQSGVQPVADLVLINGVIYTGDPKQPRVEAVAVRGEKITAAGTSAEIRKLAAPSARVIDLRGAFAMPGFNDAHLHLGSAGQGKLEVNLEGAKSLAEFQQRIRDWVAKAQPGEWILGRGWDYTLWSPANFPTKADIDQISDGHPMFLVHISGHVAVANSKALEIAEITAETPNPAGAEIERGPDGQPDGMLKEGAAQNLVSRHIPPPTAVQRRRGLDIVFAELAAAGVTSVQDNSSWDDFLTYRAMKNEGKLTARVTEWLPFDAPLLRLEEMRKEGGTTDPWLKTGALKGFMDGALGSRTAAMLVPYSDDPKTSGIVVTDLATLNQKTVERDKAGFQINFHAIGDRANNIALDAFAAALAANGPRDRRDRIEHAQIVAPDDFARFASLHVIASMQPSHETTDMRWAESRIGPERSKGAYAWKTMLNHGVMLNFGTDYPVESVNPMRGVHACVTRALPGEGPDKAWEPQEIISTDECLRAYTVGSAYGEFEEGKKGQIIPGQFADIVVLSADITKIPPAEISGVKVTTTIVGGKVVFERTSSSASR